MATIRFFRENDGDVHELPEVGPFPYERDLQSFFEKHLRTLTGVEFLDSEYSTGRRRRRRIDTLGIDGAGRPVVVEYKRHRDENVINQGLEYLVWLEDHPAEFRERVREKLGDARVSGIDFGTSRLLCIAGEFLERDRIAAQNSRRRVELLRYRRYGDSFVSLEWVYDGEAVGPSPRSAAPLRHADDNHQLTDVPRLVRSSPRNTGEDPDYSIYENWSKTREKTRDLFFRLKTSVESLGSVRTEAFKTEMSFKCLDAPGKEKVIAYVYLLVREVRIRLLISKKYVSHIPLEDGFSRISSYPGYHEVSVRDDADILRARPMLRAAHDGLSAHNSPRLP